MSDLSVFGGFLAFGAVAILIALVFGILIYVLTCLGNYKYLTMMEHQTPFAAWIPFWGQFCMAQTVPVDSENKVLIFNNFKVPQMVLCLYWLIGWGVSFIPVIGALAGVVINFLGGFVTYRYIYSKLDGKQESEVIGKAAITAFIPFLLLFAMNKYNKSRNL